MDNTLMPDIEDDVPLPSNAMEALPELSPTEELEMRARTIKLISDLTGVAILPNVDQAEAAKDLARDMMTDPKKRIEYAKYPSETMAYLAGLIAQTNVSLVDELSDLKMYVVNKLIFEVENAPDSKTRITALSKLGEVDGVDAFKRRTEMTVQIKPMAEVEKELLEALNVLETKFVEVQPAEIARHNEFTQHAE
jgi:hypothetical protein